MKKSEQDIADLIEKILIKKAKGYCSKEITEEYGISDGQAILLKKKVAIKNIPPDINACKLLITAFDKADNYESLSDIELNDEKLRLIKLLKESEQIEN